LRVLFLVGQVGERDVRTFTGVGDGDGRTDAGVRSGDQRAAAGEAPGAAVRVLAVVRLRVHP
jgi:hypothetical protein